MLVPVLLIGLSVDYALQITGRYREALLAEDVAAADRPGAAMATAVRSSGVPVLLAAGTTAVSFLTNLTSKFEPVADFGIVAGIGVVSGWIVMTSFVPAARLVADRRRVAKDRRPATRAVADTIPGVETFLSRAATTIVRRPAADPGGRRGGRDPRRHRLRRSRHDVRAEGLRAAWLRHRTGHRVPGGELRRGRRPR